MFPRDFDAMDRFLMVFAFISSGRDVVIIVVSNG